MKLRSLFLCIYFFGCGVTIHAIANELYWKAVKEGKEPWSEILTLQGEWIGIALMLVSVVVLEKDTILENIRKLRKRISK